MLENYWRYVLLGVIGGLLTFPFAIWIADWNSADPDWWRNWVSATSGWAAAIVAVVVGVKHLQPIAAQYKEQNILAKLNLLGNELRHINTLYGTLTNITTTDEFKKLKHFLSGDTAQKAAVAQLCDFQNEITNLKFVFSQLKEVQSESKNCFDSHTFLVKAITPPPFDSIQLGKLIDIGQRMIQIETNTDIRNASDQATQFLELMNDTLNLVIEWKAETKEYKVLVLGEIFSLRDSLK